jgi:hypothetical protein
MSYFIIELSILYAMENIHSELQILLRLPPHISLTQHPKPVRGYAP